MVPNHCIYSMGTLHLIILQEWIALRDENSIGKQSQRVQLQIQFHPDSFWVQRMACGDSRSSAECLMIVTARNLLCPL